MLLVEDNASDVYVTVRALKECGIQVHLQFAPDGEQALSMLRQSEVGGEHELLSLILLDWNLPGVTGADVLASRVPDLVLLDLNIPTWRVQPS